MLNTPIVNAPKRASNRIMDKARSPTDPTVSKTTQVVVSYEETSHSSHTSPRHQVYIQNLPPPPHSSKNLIKHPAMAQSFPTML